MGAGKKILVISGIVVLMLAVYFTFFFSYECEDKACFQAHQLKCSKTQFVNNAEDITWFYYIKGKEDSRCEIEVSILQVKKGSLEKQVLEGKSMNCYLPLEDLSSPETDISICHGILKEELQSLIIRELHSYILESVGEIGEELEKTV